MNNKYSRKIECILEEGKKCKEKLCVIGPTGPTGPQGPALVARSWGISGQSTSQQTCAFRLNPQRASADNCRVYPAASRCDRRCNQVTRQICQRRTAEPPPEVLHVRFRSGSRSLELHRFLSQVSPATFPFFL